MTTRCDVVVVGLGAVGSATTYQLASAGATVVGIDRGSPPHTDGSSHGATRITRLAVGEGGEYVPLVRRSHELWREIEAQTGRELLVACGGLIMGRPTATGQHGVADFTTTTIEIARAHGIDHEVLSADEVRERFGVFGVTDELAYFEPSAGYLRPEACVAAQLELAERLGATIRRDETVRSVVEHADGVLVETSAGSYAAGSVVLAGGPWMPSSSPPWPRRSRCTARCSSGSQSGRTMGASRRSPCSSGCTAPARARTSTASRRSTGPTVA